MERQQIQVPQPQVVPTVPTLDVVDGQQNGVPVKLVVMTLHTPTGKHVTFWDAPSAQNFGRTLLEVGRVAELGGGSGLIVPMPQVPKDLLNGDGPK